ncbi:hypothetical protein [Apilactobacillus kunkeei]|uniref:hypothetical protein n=1 Tax=Apilactobacillus kunkeei TaxID=148814 RepID=UPI00200B4140|nr:hypothetical protein [Apilactobacillus kunkeei]MCK8625330.1 hypothetical protein [Apilactobacillus kunkeei]
MGKLPSNIAHPHTNLGSYLFKSLIGISVQFTPAIPAQIPKNNHNCKTVAVAAFPHLTADR